MVAPAASNFSTTVQCAVAGTALASQSGLPAPVRSPAMAYMSLTTAVRPANGPAAAPLSGAFRSCGTKKPLTLWWPSFGAALLRAEIPVEDFLAAPAGDAGLRQDLLEGPLDVLDAVGLSRQIGMHRDRHDLGAVLGFLVKAIERVHPAPVHLVRRVVLQRHHHDVMQLEIVGQGDHRLVRGLQGHRLVVEDPIADIFQSGPRKKIQRNQS